MSQHHLNTMLLKCLQLTASRGLAPLPGCCNSASGSLGKLLFSSVMYGLVSEVVVCFLGVVRC
jgi:hypothetical protein